MHKAFLNHPGQHVPLTSSRYSLPVSSTIQSRRYMVKYEDRWVRGNIALVCRRDRI
jgi:hypothetical protein